MLDLLRYGGVHVLMALAGGLVGWLVGYAMRHERHGTFAQQVSAIPRALPGRHRDQAAAYRAGQEDMRMAAARVARKADAEISALESEIQEMGRGRR